MNFSFSKLVIFLLVIRVMPLCGMTSPNFYDPYPLYSTANPHEFLYTSGKEIIRGITEPQIPHERANVTLTPFIQWSHRGKDANKLPVPLGDIHGTWNMLALTYTLKCPHEGPTPQLDEATYTQYCDITSSNGCTDSFPFPSPVLFSNDNAFTFSQVAENVAPGFGRVSVRTKYQKAGFRMESALMVLNDLGLKFQAGVANIKQEVIGYRDLSGIDKPESDDACRVTCPCCVEQNFNNVQALLTGTQAIVTVGNEIGLDMSNYHKAQFEDVRLTAFWRHAVACNYDSDHWPRFLLMPFFQVIGAIGVSPEINPNKMFAIADGNNGHNAIGFDVGLSLDFEETIEFAVAGGGTMFSSNEMTIRMPTHPAQDGIYRCTAKACIKPGNNWHFTATIFARHFIENLSAHATFVMVSHEKDKISAVQPKSYDFTIPPIAGKPFFLPKQLEDVSFWDVRFGDIGINYDISPNIALGLLWRIPLSERAAPRVDTLLASFVANF